MYIRASIEAKLILGSVLAFAWAAPASATLFQVRPLLLPDGYSISGTITTDGAVGSLGASDITAWSISVSQVTTLLDLTKSNSSALLSQVSVGASGELNVATSADGSADGGLLQFGSYPRYVSVADFTGINASGGAVAYRLGRTGTTAPLGQPDASLYQAGVATMPGRFVVPTQLIDGPAGWDLPFGLDDNNGEFGSFECGRADGLGHPHSAGLERCFHQSEFHA